MRCWIAEQGHTFKWSVSIATDSNIKRAKHTRAFNEENNTMFLLLLFLDFYRCWEQINTFQSVVIKIDYFRFETKFEFKS